MLTRTNSEIIKIEIASCGFFETRYEYLSLMELWAATSKDVTPMLTTEEALTLVVAYGRAPLKLEDWAAEKIPGELASTVVLSFGASPQVGSSCDREKLARRILTMPTAEALSLVPRIILWWCFRRRLEQFAPSTDDDNCCLGKFFNVVDLN